MARPRLNPTRKRQFQRALLAWFAEHGRDLPWRRTTNPYRILVSEVMLQQTQVERVKGYYARFLRRFPSVKALAEAPEPQVLAAWDGLGYYNRARNLKRAAEHIREEHAGYFPRGADQIEKLPGVGKYTAGAVRSFAFGEDAPILDTNVRRVLWRVFGVKGAPTSTPTTRRLWYYAEEIVPPGRAREFNSALMDFGATVCTARAPRCPACPMRAFCLRPRVRPASG